jgi:hypothetical protein
MDMIRKKPKHNEILVSGADVPTLTLQDKAIKGVLESYLEKILPCVDKEHERPELPVEKARTVTEMLGGNDMMTSMLAVQMMSVHDAMTSHAQNAKDPNNHQAVNALAKLANCFIQQAGMMERLKGSTQQKVEVRHVHVHAGGQAIVGSITGEG